MNKMTNAEVILRQRDLVYAEKLREIGEAIGYGNAQRILGELWDDMLEQRYSAPRGRGPMGVTVDDGDVTGKAGLMPETGWDK